MSPSVNPEPKEVRELRELVKDVLKGGNKTPHVFGELIGKLLQFTVARDSGGHIVVVRSNKSNYYSINGWNKVGMPIPLKNGCYLRLAMEVYLNDSDPFMRTEKSNYQYQKDELGNQWVFRYDYNRNPKDKHPPSHIQIRGKLFEEVELSRRNLERVHFPTRRISVESILRLLINDFAVPCNNVALGVDGVTPLWDLAITATEQEFLNVAHQ